MATEGMGTCLVPKDSGVPCGRQIEQGEPIRNLVLPVGGVLVGHRDCVDAYETRKQDTDMVKRVDQQGANGPVDMTKATDGIMGSIPLDRSPGKHEKAESDDRSELVTEGSSWPEGVVPVASLPFREPVDNWAQGLPDKQPAPMVELEPTDSALRVVTYATELIAIFAKYGIGLDPKLLADLILWRHDA